MPFKLDKFILALTLTASACGDGGGADTTDGDTSSETDATSSTDASASASADGDGDSTGDGDGDSTGDGDGDSTGDGDGDTTGDGDGDSTGDGDGDSTGDGDGDSTGDGDGDTTGDGDGDGDGGCEPITDDPSAIGLTCTPDPDTCPDGYVCGENTGIVLTHACRIECTDDCECPDTTTCQQMSDKAGTWMECRP